MSKKEPESAKELFERAQAALAKAEEGLVKSFNKAVKEFSERLTEVQGEARRRFDDAVAQLSHIKDQETFTKVSAMRDELESRVEQGTEAFWSALGLATKAEVQEAQRKIAQLQKKVKELEAGKKAVGRRAEA